MLKKLLQLLIPTILPVQPEEEEFGVDMRMVQEPILTFVECVKKNPSRFRCRKEGKTQGDGLTRPPRRGYSHRNHRSQEIVAVTDLHLKRSWRVQLNTHPDAGRLSRCRVIEGLDFSLNAWESTYLFLQLSPVFERGYERIRQRRRRQADEDQARAISMEQVARMKMLEEYRCRRVR